MKFFIVTFAIAAFVQFTAAGPILRHKRGDFFVESFVEAIEVIKGLNPHAEKLLRSSLRDIPRTPAYAKYIELFDGYLKDIEKQKITPGNCFEKSVAGLERLIEFLDAVGVDRVDIDSSEHTEIIRIMEINGIENIRKDLESFIAKYTIPQMEKEMEEEITLQDDFRIAPYTAEVC